ncbi:MAG: hypothetical protein RSB99_01610 [Bacilli bacterium]
MNITDLEELLKKIENQNAINLEVEKDIKKYIQNMKAAEEKSTEIFSAPIETPVTSEADLNHTEIIKEEPSVDDFINGLVLSDPVVSPDENLSAIAVPIIEESKVEEKPSAYTGEIIDDAIRTLINPNASSDGFENAVNILSTATLPETKYNEVMEKATLASHLTADVRTKIRTGLKKESPIIGSEENESYEFLVPKKIIGSKALEENLLTKIGNTIKTIPARLEAWIEKKKEAKKLKKEAEANIAIPEDKDILNFDYQQIMMLEKTRYSKNGQDDEESLLHGITMSARKKDVIVAQMDNMQDKNAAYLKCVGFLKKHPDEYEFVKFNNQNISTEVSSITGVEKANEGMYGLVSKNLINAINDIYGMPIQPSNEFEFGGKSK